MTEHCVDYHGRNVLGTIPLRLSFVQGGPAHLRPRFSLLKSGILPSLPNCSIVPGQVEIWQNGQSSKAAMAEHPIFRQQKIVSDVQAHPVACLLQLTCCLVGKPQQNVGPRRARSPCITVLAPLLTENEAGEPDSEGRPVVQRVVGVRHCHGDIVAAAAAEVFVSDVDAIDFVLDVQKSSGRF